MLSLIDMFQTVQLKSKNNEGRNSVLYSEISDYLCEVNNIKDLENIRV